MRIGACFVAAPTVPGVRSTKEVANPANVVRSNRERRSATRRVVLSYPSSARTAGLFDESRPVTLGEGGDLGNSP
jgi:hypothetical protein